MNAPVPAPATAPLPGQARVLVVDDDLSMREALASLIGSAGWPVESFASAAELLQRLQTPLDGPACLVLDVRMPGMTGLELQRELTQSGCRLPIVFLTAHGDIPMTVRAIKAGALEFLPKPFDDEALLGAIAQGLAEAAQAWQAQQDSRALRARYEALTQREREVMQWLLQGLRNKQTADRLGISEVTVKVHRHRMMEKMAAGSLPELIAMLDRLGVPRADPGMSQGPEGG